MRWPAASQVVSRPRPVSRRHYDEFTIALNRPYQRRVVPPRVAIDYQAGDVAPHCALFLFGTVQGLPSRLIARVLPSPSAEKPQRRLRDRSRSQSASRCIRGRVIERTCMGEAGLPATHAQGRQRQRDWCLPHGPAPDGDDRPGCISGRVPCAKPVISKGYPVHMHYWILVCVHVVCR